MSWVALFNTAAPSSLVNELDAAESRVLTEADLHCWRLPTADEDYVLSVANLGVPTAEIESQRMLVSVRLLGTPAEPVMPELAALTGNYLRAPVPFDPRYATAVAGDTLRFVDWFSGKPQICQDMCAGTDGPWAFMVLVRSGTDSQRVLLLVFEDAERSARYASLAAPELDIAGIGPPAA